MYVAHLPEDKKGTTTRQATATTKLQLSLLLRFFIFNEIVALPVRH